MRSLFTLLFSIASTFSAQAQITTYLTTYLYDEQYSGDGQHAEKESASSSASAILLPPIAEFKSIQEARAAKAKKIEEARAKDAQSDDEVAAKIAEKLVIIRKEKAARANVSSQSNVSNQNNSNGIHKEGTTTNKKSLSWSYEGDGGPQNWGKLNPLYTQCEVGDRQSPIDIRDGFRVDLDELRFDYKHAQFNVTDNGHTIQVGVNNGNYINISGKDYELIQFHFHRPAEERINGKAFAMVVHLVHKDIDGKLAVVAILIELGKSHDIVQTVWNNLPLEKKITVKALQEIDLSQLLPKTLQYYTYMGSLTTPPCSEGVLWIVMKEPIEISSDQITIFSRIYPMNARPLQKSSSRMIKESR
jgi:carbonic anhydrase